MMTNQNNAVKPIHRWLARIMDLALWTPFGYAVFVTAVLTLNRLSSNLVEKASDAVIITYLISGALSLFILMLVDSLVATLFGNTPGKALMRINVVDSYGSKLTLAKYLRRNLYVANSGFGWSVPLVGSALMILQFVRVLKGRPTTYDESIGYCVGKSGNIGVWRSLAFALLFLFALSVQAAATLSVNQIVNPYGWYVGTAAIVDALVGP